MTTEDETSESQEPGPSGRAPRRAARKSFVDLWEVPDELANYLEEEDDRKTKAGRRSKSRSMSPQRQPLRRASLDASLALSTLASGENLVDEAEESESGDPRRKSRARSLNRQPPNNNSTNNRSRSRKGRNGRRPSIGSRSVLVSGEDGRSEYMSPGPPPPMEERPYQEIFPDLDILKPVNFVRMHPLNGVLTDYEEPASTESSEASSAGASNVPSRTESAAQIEPAELDNAAAEAQPEPNNESQLPKDTTQPPSLKAQPSNVGRTNQSKSLDLPSTTSPNKDKPILPITSETVTEPGKSTSASEFQDKPLPAQSLPTKDSVISHPVTWIRSGFDVLFGALKARGEVSPSPSPTDEAQEPPFVEINGESAPNVEDRAEKPKDPLESLFDNEPEPVIPTAPTIDAQEAQNLIIREDPTVPIQTAFPSFKIEFTKP
ncbi:hypothetical protein HDV05_001714, partial [Chytridiales sp. JEL 0842]